MAKPSKQVRCTLLIPDPSKEGGWGCIPSPSITEESIFVNLTLEGIRLSFPRDADCSVWAWYSRDLGMKPSTLHHVSIDLRGSSADVRQLNDDETNAFKVLVDSDEAEDFRIVTFTSTPDEPCRSRITGFGTPFHGLDATVDGYVNQDTQICGVASLSEVLQRSEFTILINETQIGHIISGLEAPRKPEKFGYGEVHTWDMARYGEQVPELIGHAFYPRVRFENANERDTALTQMHVQDVWHFNAALEERIGEESVDRTTEFVCLLEPDNLFEPKHWRAARRAVWGDACKLEVTFKPSATWSVTWEAFHLTIATSDHLRGVDLNRRIALLLTRPEENSRGHKFCPSSYPKYPRTGKDLKKSTVTFRCHLNLRHEELRVSAINRLSSQAISPSVMEADTRNPRRQAIFKELVTGNGFWSLQKQGTDVRLPSFDIFGGIPTDVRDACLNHVFEDDRERVQQYFGKLYLGLGLVSGPPGTGKSHLASIVVILMCFNKFINHVYVAAASNGATDNIIERIDSMTEAITRTLPKNHVKRLIHSLCWWTMRVLGSERVPQLDADNNIELRDLHQRLSALVAPSSNDSELLPFQQLLMKLVVGCANVVATTPATSASSIYRCFNDTKARAVVFDEAATMFCSDGLLVYGNTPRPMIAIGDPKQLAPNLTTAFELLQGNQSKHDRRQDRTLFLSDRVPTNRFAKFAIVSWLSWFIHLGWPVFHLYTQHRMAEGLFDLSLHAVYESLMSHFTYSPSCHPTNFSLGLKVEEYLKAEHRIPSSPENTLQPVFFHCVNCPCREYEDSLSRLNPRQADVIAEFLVKMICELELPPEDIVVLTPYRASRGAIAKRFREEPVLEGVELTTFNKFQGREAQIVVLALCVDAKTGPLFVAEERSLNVALTRQRSSLLIFGDINTRPNPPPDEEEAQEKEARINPAVFEHVFRMIRASGRIVQMRGDENYGPDSRWKPRDQNRSRHQNRSGRGRRGRKV
ncbi:unnamed protein product [Fusarium venenatum]|uniref:Uncharacterized protein n=1 Tax=Fusarium venenatum TaxID=56646 RepID=A0A2L2SS33_9HYPO|nr:uncharacterized protein FVRRES_13877 [Fusarium venenatum]CEI42076.1 unnamed protein product [Fusarium venenatum]